METESGKILKDIQLYSERGPHQGFTDVKGIQGNDKRELKNRLSKGSRRKRARNLLTSRSPAENSGDPQVTDFGSKTESSKRKDRSTM